MIHAASFTYTEMCIKSYLEVCMIRIYHFVYLPWYKKQSIHDFLILPSNIDGEIEVG